MLHFSIILVVHVSDKMHYNFAGQNSTDVVIYNVGSKTVNEKGDTGRDNKKPSRYVVLCMQDLIA